MDKSHAIKVSALPISSSARKREEASPNPLPKRGLSGLVEYVFVIVFVSYAAHDAMPSAPARAVNTAMRTLRSLLKFTFFIMV